MKNVFDSTTWLSQSASLLLVWIVLANCSAVVGQSTVRIELKEGWVECPEETVRLKHVARISLRTPNPSRINDSIAMLDLDSFTVSDEVSVTRRQIEIRLQLAGVEPGDVEMIGPEKVLVRQIEQTCIRDRVESKLQQLFSQHYRIPTTDLSIFIDSQCEDKRLARWDFSSLRIGHTLPVELSLGKQTINVTVRDELGRDLNTRIPITVAVVREIVVARKPIARGEILSADHLEAIRRPISDRNIRLASYEQAIGQQVQTDIQQYDLIKSSVLHASSPTSKFVIRRNDRVNLIMRRGQMKLVMRDAKALGNGNPGDPITMLNPTSNEKIPATVVDSMTVEVRF